MKILDKNFEKSIPEADILNAVRRVAERMTADYADKNPVFVVVLNGAFVFAADLLRMIDFPCELAFTKLESYDGLSSSGKITVELPISSDVSGRHVVIVEDIVDTGYSMKYLTESIATMRPASIEVCALFCKPENLMVQGLDVKYTGMSLPEAFIVGYGLDYNQQGRLLRDIYSLKEE